MLASYGQMITSAARAKRIATANQAAPAIVDASFISSSQSYLFAKGNTMGEGNPAVVTMVVDEIRQIVLRNKQQAEITPELCSDVLKAGATSIAEISKLIEELQVARDYLHSEDERVHRMVERYAHLTTTASASVKIVSDSLGKWVARSESGVVPQPDLDGQTTSMVADLREMSKQMAAQPRGAGKIEAELEAYRRGVGGGVG